MPTKLNALILGATGLCGSALLKYTEQSGLINKVFTITRRPIESDKTAQQIVEKDNSKWISHFPTDKIDILMTGLATTKKAAGGAQQQYYIDHDLNIDFAKKAKENGCSTFVVVSSAGASADSRFFYLKMKGEIERDLKAIDFDHLIILRPGPLLGERQENLKGFGNSTFTTLGNWVYRSRLQALVGHPVFGDEVGQVGVHLALKALKDKSSEKVQIVESNEILCIAAELNQHIASTN
ncbi:hypothetical protein TBLA_0A10500 [Henningerozyma blattae CBS 6284]|uniref:Protein FMP52, mitochondrial n=1 Tax=Henningerozyma blattae (strain ATCC 34711 / CBS 6284 / DSM 70876 / NBRC 10599 / NRRL Y-10934 / UCD 77-7) TaxID=1071380 RepID=I2GXH6_HENB6|nr:hypothetical protein TBLA_0A10500 [Tetrapisispora blattae CBS 6284]CCH58828.1 hypothetical protein TBLA_0A10500 [Tetrapisispora blattae CBS 6284]